MDTFLYIICGTVLLILLLGALRLMWKISRWLLLPVQIVLFLFLVAVALKLLVTKDNVQYLDKTVQKHLRSEKQEKTDGEQSDERDY